MTLPIIVSAYTPNTPYEEMAGRLRASCNALELAHDIVTIPPGASWEATTCAKASVCRDAWRRLERPILWVDADAVIHRRPNLLLGSSADFAVHRWKHKLHIITATVFFNQTRAAGDLLDAWVARCAADHTVSDQEHLDRLWKTMPDLLIQWLPRSYCQIFDAAREDPDIVIEQFQASRLRKPPKAKAS